MEIKGALTSTKGKPTGGLDPRYYTPCQLRCGKFVPLSYCFGCQASHSYINCEGLRKLLKNGKREK
jgi:hypothetical protein